MISNLKQYLLYFFYERSCSDLKIVVIFKNNVVYDTL